ncbi:MAG: hypothetical protein NTY45_08355 [Elusimicrobia bacterium]|nr:hypothetical protein [Elusimicrobiota bacterium]
MKIKTISVLAMIFIPAAIAATAHKRHCAHPSDLRDAVGESPALEQLGGTGVAMPSSPEPQTVKADSRQNFTRAGAANANSLMSVAFTREDIMTLIASSRVGSELLGHFQNGEAELPAFTHVGLLAPADREVLRAGHIVNEEDRVAVFLKDERFMGGRAHVVFYKADWPLFATACVAVHELQHAIDRNAPWYLHIANMRKTALKKFADAESKGSLTSADLNLNELAYGLGYMNTFFTEYLAYSRSSELFKELGGRNTAAKSQVSLFRKSGKNEKSIVEFDPLNDPQDRSEFMDRYFWPGNRIRFKAGAAAVLTNKKLIGELKAAELSTAIAELAAFYDSPDPVYQPVYSLK